MKFKNRLGFRSQLLIAGFLVQLSTLGLFSWGSSVLFKDYFEKTMQARLDQTRPLLKASLLTPLLQRDYASINAVLNEVIAGADFIYIEVCDPSGILIASAGRQEPKGPILAEDKQISSEMKKSSGGMQSMLMELDGSKVGSVKFELSTTRLQAMVNVIVNNLAYLSLLALAAFMLMLWAIAHVLTRPLLQLAHASEKIRSGNYDLIVSESKHDEIGQLIYAFNQMTLEIREKISTLTVSENLQKIYLEDLQKQKIILENALKQAQGATRTKAEFLSTMSHEIRTPMNAILGFSQLLKETDVDQRQIEYINSIHSSATSLLSLFNDILDFSKLESGQMKLVSRSFSLSDVIQSAINLFIFQIKEKNLHINSEISSDIPKYLLGDATRIRQILVNLIGNAIKFTAQGEVRVEVCQIAGPESYLLQFSVTDTGVGMSPEQQARIFAPFSQGDSSNTKRFGGSGLGLAISRHLIDMMGGELLIKSTPGLGSCVTFTCQVQATFDNQLATQTIGHPQGLEPPKEGLLLSDAPQLTGIKVLLVEDDKFNAMLALAFLHKLGMQVCKAANGLEAIQALAQNTFDVVLMDLQMPELDGLSATRQIKARWGDAAPPIIAMSAATQAEDLQDCEEAGMVDHISKPVELESMKAVLQRCLQGDLKPAVIDSGTKNTLDEIDAARLDQLSDKLQQSLTDNLTSARKLCDEITSFIKGTTLTNAFRPVSEHTRRLKYKDALMALADFRQKIVNKCH